MEDLFAKNFPSTFYTWLFKRDYTSLPSTSPSFLIHNNIFDVMKKKSKDYYLLLDMEKVQPPSIIQKWESDFNLLDDSWR